MSRFLDFDITTSNAAILVNNYDWMKDISLIDFVRDTGKHITVNYMMAKDSVKKRLGATSKEGMSFTEFTYQLFQGYDFTTCTKNTIVRYRWAVRISETSHRTELIRRKSLQR